MDILQVNSFNRETKRGHEGLFPSVRSGVLFSIFFFFLGGGGRASCLAVDRSYDLGNIARVVSVFVC